MPEVFLGYVKHVALGANLRGQMLHSWVERSENGPSEDRSVSTRMRRICVRGKPGLFSMKHLTLSAQHPDPSSAHCLLCWYAGLLGTDPELEATTMLYYDSIFRLSRYKSIAKIVVKYPLPICLSVP